MAKKEDSRNSRKKISSEKKFEKKSKPVSSKGKRGSSRISESGRGNSDRAPLSEKKSSRPQNERGEKNFREERSYGNKSPRSYGQKSDRNYREDKPYGKKSAKPYGERSAKSYSERSAKPYGERSAKPYGERSESNSRDENPYKKKSYGSKPYGSREKFNDGDRKPYRGKFKSDRPTEFKPKKNDGLMRLNKFLSNAGIASRRDADNLIELGLVKVNGKVITELGFKVDPRVDVVKYDDKNLKPEKLQYVLLNKPKDFITTMDDPEERKTVMWLVKEACKERIYPVGRLDRQTTGLLLFTNDGDLAKKLTHPRYGVQKIYHVETLQKVKGTDIDAIRDGIQLEDGFIKADEISFVNGDPRQIGIRIHSGRNRIVRRIFEHFQYTVKKLDRVMFAGLTKKDLSRGRYRHLTDQEVNFLKMVKASSK